jgi:hypothetical protein
MTDQPPMLPPAGWHDDPNDPSSLRYWDGQAWSEQRAPKPTPSAPAPVGAAPSSATGWPAHRIVAAGAAVGVIIGSVSPWATITFGFGQISVNGTDGDGQLTLIGGVAILLLVVFSKYLASLILSVITAAVLLYDYFNISSSIDVGDDTFASASVGWGIQLATVAAIVAVIASFLMMQRAKAAENGAAFAPPA